MKLSAQLTLFISVAFALLCIGYAAYGWYETGAMPADQEREDARGFVFFWLFLGGIAVASAWYAWRLTRRDDL